MKEKVMSMEPDAWKYAVEYEYEDAYSVAGMKPILPHPDEFNMTEETAEQVYRKALSVKPIHQSQAAIPIFNTSIMFDEGNSTLAEIVNDFDNPYGNYIYGMDALFVGYGGGISCEIGFHYADHSGGGYEKVGTVLIQVDGDYFFTMPQFMEWSAIKDFKLYDYRSITRLCNYLGYFWRGIQHEMIYRPEVVRTVHRRVPTETKAEIRKQYKNKCRITKVQRVISIVLDEEDEVEITHSGNKITLSLWSVSGHWRVLKSGKRVWIAPYMKGKDRNKSDGQLSPKKYQFVEGDEINA